MASRRREKMRDGEEEGTQNEKGLIIIDYFFFFSTLKFLSIFTYFLFPQNKLSSMPNYNNITLKIKPKILKILINKLTIKR